jgi:rare lipoprotein A
MHSSRPIRAAALLLLGLLAGCHHHTQPPSRQSRSNAPELTPPSAPYPPHPSGKIIFSEVGGATWYHARTPNELTAAHKTLPYNTQVRVTNLVTGQSATVRITDRGPFVRGRIIDLSVASAKATGIYRMGIAKVKLEVFSAPAPISTGGRWAVQIGAFSEIANADSLRAKLVREFPTANVVEYTSSTGHWLRVRPPRDDKQQAIEIADAVSPDLGDAYLVRLD